jgi:two-component system chemotaxis sensor kinase CheA
MSSDLDDELRQDFVTESSELVARLDEQLIALEREPGSSDLLNAVFRGFHTVKGGAGFFALSGVVDLCHCCEDVFNSLRGGRLALTPEIMDDVLTAADLLRSMLASVAENRTPPPAPAELIQRLRAAAQTPAAAAQPAAAAPAPPRSGLPEPTPVVDPFSDDEFEALLNSLHGNGCAPGVSATPEAEPLAAPTAPAPAAAEPRVEMQRNEAPAAPAAAPHAEATETSIRIETHRLDQVMNLIGELVLVRNRLKIQAPRSGLQDLRKTLAELDAITSSLQGSVMQMRMQQIKKLFSRFPRLARETARKIGKQVEIVVLGEETELDKSLVEALGDPLVHMVRNAIDHGIEAPADRERAGKPRAGTLTMAAEQQGNHILITVSDDGAGIDPDKLRRKAIEKGLLTQAAASALSRDESLQLIFLAGLSTKDQVSELSGRGVGMDVVRASIGALNGSVQIESTLGQGTRFSIRVPLTLAIQPVLMVMVGPRLFAIPLQHIRDVFALDDSTLRRLDRWDVIPYREQALRLMHLSKWAGQPLPDDQRPHVVVAEVGGETIGLVVGHVRAREEIVVKPLGRLLQGLAGLAGATVTGEGRVALLLDLQGLMHAHERGI